MELFEFILVVICLLLGSKVISLDKKVSDLSHLLEDKITQLEKKPGSLGYKTNEKDLNEEEPPQPTEEPAPPSHTQTVHKAEAKAGPGDAVTAPVISAVTEPLNVMMPPELPDDLDKDEPVPMLPVLEIPIPQASPIKPSAIPAVEAEGPAREHATAEKQSDFSKRWKEFKENVDWELFTGTKLFAWTGVFALFVGMLFFVKLSMDRGWFPPAFRLAIGAVAGLALCLFSLKRMRDGLTLLKHTLASAGIGTLYGVVFTSTLFYDYLPETAGFFLLSLITATAFVLAVYHKGISISILGAVGAYMTPVLVSTGQGSLVMLFLYAALVNTGLYLVMTRLSAPLLLLVASAGTLVTLGLGTASTFGTTTGNTVGVVWTANLVLFSLYLYLQRHRPLSENKSLVQCGVLTWTATLGMALILTISKPGWMPLVLITVSVSGAMILTWFQSGWYGYLVPHAAMTFAVALGWTFFRFDAANVSPSFLLIFLYGGTGCLGPLVLVRKHGITPQIMLWFKRFPFAVSALCLAGLLKDPACSFLFWPVMLGVQLIGIGISLLARAFVQVLLLIVLFVAGGLVWMLNIPQGGLGTGFFAFILLAGTLLTLLLTVVASRLPGIIKSLHMDDQAGDGQKSGEPFSGRFDQWLAATPSTGVFILLGAAFMVEFPHFPHPGMATLCCFLALSLFFSKRALFEPSAVTSLAAGILAQAVWVLAPFTGLILSGVDIFYPAVLWSSCLFVAALFIPFLFFRDHETWLKTWNTFALFELAQFLFLLVSAKHLFTGQWVNWIPLLPFALKLPFVALLMKQLKEKQQRNAILAFHGGVLLFYVSTLPVLVLHHGWIGLALVIEATALLWLNTRINHPGLKKTATVMSPIGLVILLVSLPLLKTADSMKIFNSAVFSMAAAIGALSAAVKLSAWPGRKLRHLDLPGYYLWLALFSGFYLTNLMIADLFAPADQVFKLMPAGNFVHSAFYALSWALFGTILWKMKTFPQAMRTTGFIILCAGTVHMLVLPVIQPTSISHMAPLFNPALFTFLPFLLILYLAFHTESYGTGGSISKNTFLAMFLVTLFMMIKTVKSTMFQNGYPFSLVSEHTPSHSVASAAAMFAYGTALLIWPRRLDRPFRLAGLILVFVSMARAAHFPLRFSGDFGAMAPIFNTPTALYLFILCMLVFFSKRTWTQSWPIRPLPAKTLWAVVFTLAAFYVMNVEIASIFGNKSMGFTFATRHNWGKQFGYSLGWLFFSIGLLIAGIRLKSTKTRWAAIVLLSITTLKIFFTDLWSLGQLYRVGSFIGLAVVLILVSYLYQRFIAGEETADTAIEPDGIRAEEKE